MPEYYPRLHSGRRFAGAVVPLALHSHGSIPRRASFLLTGSRRCGSPPFKRYYWRATTSDSPSLTLRSSLHARLSGWLPLFARDGGATAANAPGICSAGMPRVRLSPGKLPDLPSSHETLAPNPAAAGLGSHLRPALRPRSNRLASPMRHHSVAHSSKTPRTSTMRQFRGSITRPGARCLRFVPSLPSTTQDSLTAGG
jgi:hypothetical protein